MSERPSLEPRPSDARSPRDHVEKIEQLLLAGLDAYFAGQHEQAINVWTRVVFLDRHDDRARAYIERDRVTVLSVQMYQLEYLFFSCLQDSLNQACSMEG
mgnify:CR=1 FL=1